MKALLEQAVLLAQTLWYLTGITVLIVLALWFHQSMQAQQAAQTRAEARSDQVLFESRQALQDHQQIMQRLAR